MANENGINGYLARAATALEAILAASPTDIAPLVDGLEALVTSTNGYVDGLEALLGTTNTALTTLQGYVDGLEGFTDGLEGVLGTTAGAAVVTDANGTVQQYLRGIIVRLSTSVFGPKVAGSCAISLTMIPRSSRPLSARRRTCSACRLCPRPTRTRSSITPTAPRRA